MISALVGRRVYLPVSGRRLYPNTYTILIAPPGGGKTTQIEVVSEVWVKNGNVRVAPTALSRASLTDVLAQGAKNETLPDGSVEIHHSLCIASGEFANFIRVGDFEMPALLCDLWDNISVYQEVKRTTLKDKLSIDNPHIVMIAGTTPKYLGSLMPGNIFENGLMSRCHPYYVAKSPTPKLFETLEPDSVLMAKIIRDSQVISQLRGPMKIEPTLIKLLEDWMVHQRETEAPSHPRLADMNARRHICILKDSMLFALGDGNSMEIQHKHFEQARELCLLRESGMVELIESLTTSDYGQIILDLMGHLWGKAVDSCVSELHINNYLSDRIDPIRVSHVKNLLKDTGRMREVGWYKERDQYGSEVPTYKKFMLTRRD